MKVGYARVSTNEQDTYLQIDALKAIGCELIYQEKQSGAKKGRDRIPHGRRYRAWPRHGNQRQEAFPANV